MKLTRNDFKHLVEIHKRVWDAYNELNKYYNEDIIGEILFKGIYWIGEKTELMGSDGDFDVLFDLMCRNSLGAAINFREEENGEWSCDYSKDLDEVYDYYFVKDGQEPQMTLFSSFEELDEYHAILEEINKMINELDNYYNTDAFINEAYEAIGWLGMKIEDAGGFECFI